MQTTSTAWLGLTMQCAQCHTHKYDPITQKEYYQFFALLDNADEPTSFDVPSQELPQDGASRSNSRSRSWSRNWRTTSPPATSRSRGRC